MLKTEHKMKITKSELSHLIMEEVKRQEKLLALESVLKNVKEELSNINEDAQMAMIGAEAGEMEDQKKESIFDAKPGETVIFNFQDVTIKVQRQLDDLFKVVDAAESKKLQDGDYIKIQGNDMLEKDRKFKFSILRKAIDYETNPLISWKVIKN
jgi:hypothetical protein